MVFDYEGACTRATTRQGLDPMVEALTAAGVTHAVEQTGGFCMVVTVTHPTGTWGVVDDGGWYAVWYPDDTWHTGEADIDEGLHTNLSIADTVALVAAPG